jgi:tRNA dimethylallyltransferase
MFNKILIISGPTATGKTDLAIKLAKEFNGELISADSRQIYKDMDIGTGKDHPKDIPIHLIDIINPNQAFSVAQYRKLALSTIYDLQSKNLLPVVVGGTGQYIDSLINPQPTFSIKPNKILRFILNKLHLKTLQRIYRFLDFRQFDCLNNSEIHNPHRLIRKIEISVFRYFHPSLLREGQGVSFDFLHLSLTASNTYLFPRIDSRVEKRLENGLLDEIETLLSKYSWNHPGLNTIAYKEFKPYFSKVGVWLAQTRSTDILNSCISEWKSDEHKYARRQKTWFNKRPDIIFVDITNNNFLKKITNLVSKWYNKP